MYRNSLHRKLEQLQHTLNIATCPAKDDTLETWFSVRMDRELQESVSQFDMPR